MADVTPTIMNMWRAELEALPDRKKSKWHSYLKDRFGERLQVKSQQGYFFMHYSQRLRATFPDAVFPAGGWAPIVEYGAICSREQLLIAYPEFATNTLFIHQLANPEERQMVQQAYADGGDLGLSWLARRVADTNFTGHHAGRVNHHVTVPTAAGQPVRG